MKMKIKIKGFRNSDLGLRIWGDGSDRTDGTYGILVPEVQGSVGSRSVATTAPAERGPTEVGVSYFWASDVTYLA